MPRRYAVKTVTARDAAILAWTGRNGLATVDQLLRQFWPGAKRSTGGDRLRQLVKAGLLTAHSCDARRAGEQVYCLTVKGRLHFSITQREHLHTGLPAAHELKQQILAGDTYLYLAAELTATGSRILDWQSERTLRSEFRLAQQAAERQAGPAPTWEIADAQVVTVTPDGTIQTTDVEIDGQYYGVMLRNKVQRFGEAGRPTLWVCDSPDRAARVATLATPYPTIRVIHV